MKKRSAPSDSSSPPELTFFSDRCLGRRFPRHLATLGIQIESYFEAFPGQDQISDPEWLRYTCGRGYVGLTHDAALRRDEETVRVVFDAAYEESSALFILRGQLSSVELGKMFLEAHPRVVRMVERYRHQNRAFIAIISRSHAKGGVETIDVRRWKDEEEWREMMMRKGGGR